MSAKETKDGGTRPGALGRGMDALMGDDGTRNTEEAHRDKADDESEKIEEARRTDAPGASNGESAEPAAANRRQVNDRASSGAKEDGEEYEKEGATVYIYDRSPFGSCPVRLVASGAAGAIAVAACVLVGVKAVLSMERSRRLF